MADRQESRRWGRSSRSISIFGGQENSTVREGGGERPKVCLEEGIRTVGGEPLGFVSGRPVGGKWRGRCHEGAI